MRAVLKYQSFKGVGQTSKTGTQEVARAMDPATREWLEESDVQVITYDDLD